MPVWLYYKWWFGRMAWKARRLIRKLGESSRKEKTEPEGVMW